MVLRKAFKIFERNVTAELSVNINTLTRLYRNFLKHRLPSSAISFDKNVANLTAVLHVCVTLYQAYRISKQWLEHLGQKI